MVTIFTSFANIFLDLGFSLALIQKNKINENHVSSVFWLNVFMGISFFIFLNIFSSCIAAFFQNNKVENIIPYLSINFILTSGYLIQRTLLKKKVDFKEIGVINLFSTILSGIIGIFFAYNDYGVWSLVINSILINVFSLVLYWYFNPWRPKFIFRIDAIKELWTFGLNVTLLNIFRYFTIKIDNILIGKFMGSTELGFYSKAYSFMTLPMQVLKGKFLEVLLPAFSLIQYDKERQRKLYLKSSELIAAILFPIICGFFCISEEFVLIFLGEKWSSIIILIQIFCVASLFNSIGLPGPLMNANGRPDLLLRLTIVTRSFMIILIVVGLIYKGLIGIAIGSTLGIVIHSLTINYYALKIIEIELNRFIISILKYIGFSFSMSLIIFFIFSVYYVNLSLLNLIVLKIITGVVLYTSFMFIFNKNLISDIKKEFKGFDKEKLNL